MLIVETERLLLRHLHILDAKAMDRVFGDPQVMRFGDGVQTKQWVRDWLQTCLENYYKKWGFGPWAVVAKDRKEVIGYCGLFYFEDIGGQPEVEVGYRLARPYWKHGYATEAVCAVRDYGFNVLSLPRLIAMIDPENTASLHVAEKAGMRYERNILFKGYTHPDYVYSITRSVTLK